MLKMNGTTYDIPDAVRGFHWYSSVDRSNRLANFRMTPGQRESLGEVFWTHEWFPNVSFPTRADARRSAIRLAVEQKAA